MEMADNKPNPLVLRTLGRAFAAVGKERGIDEWVQVGKDLNQSADALVAMSELPEKDTAGPEHRDINA